jgi:hypothetical protein
MTEQDLRAEKLSFAIGMIVGQLSELLNQIKTNNPNQDAIYNSLLDITSMAALHVNELYYKGNKREGNINGTS